jgi:hypothetical protein
MAHVPFDRLTWLTPISAARLTGSPLGLLPPQFEFASQTQKRLGVRNSQHIKWQVWGNRCVVGIHVLHMHAISALTSAAAAKGRAEQTFMQSSAKVRFPPNRPSLHSAQSRISTNGHDAAMRPTEGDIRASRSIL